MNPSDLAGIHAVVHLAGDPIDRGRWTAKKKASILNSRVNGTRLISTSIASLERPPSTLIVASASGYYGDRGDHMLTEESGPGNGFLAEVCRRWEEATEPAVQRGIRVVNLRTGLVLSTDGGLLAKLLTPFKLGVGGTLGDGRSYMSWVSLEDTIGAIEHALNTVELTGPVNVSSPNPVTNGEFTRTLGKVLRRPTLMRVPELVLKLALGREKANDLALTSARMLPAKLVASGFAFAHSDLEPALRSALAR
ncbi:MAG: hypothetical protein C1O27_002214 [Chloroflexi bacterium]|jgi:hypothetical protein|nr:MAG: hypothetical protein C1O27_002214 [Chloroflexota bacterium]